MRKNIKPLFFRYKLITYEKRFLNNCKLVYRNTDSKEGIVRFDYKNFLKISSQNIFSHFKKDLDQGRITLLREPIIFKKETKLIINIWIKYLEPLSMYEKTKITYVIENLTF